MALGKREILERRNTMSRILLGVVVRNKKCHWTLPVEGITEKRNKCSESSVEKLRSGFYTGVAIFFARSDHDWIIYVSHRVLQSLHWRAGTHGGHVDEGKKLVSKGATRSSAPENETFLRSCLSLLTLSLPFLPSSASKTFFDRVFPSILRSRPHFLSLALYDHHDHARLVRMKNPFLRMEWNDRTTDNNIPNFTHYFSFIFHFFPLPSTIKRTLMRNTIK